MSDRVKSDDEEDRRGEMMGLLKVKIRMSEGKKEARLANGVAEQYLDLNWSDVVEVGPGVGGGTKGASQGLRGGGRC